MSEQVGIAAIMLELVGGIVGARCRCDFGMINGKGSSEQVGMASWLLEYVCIVEPCWFLGRL